jgi:hypothetical protein
VVNLRPEPDPETESVPFDLPRVLRVPGRITADLEGPAGPPPVAEERLRKGGVGPGGRTARVDRAKAIVAA